MSLEAGFRMKRSRGLIPVRVDTESEEKRLASGKN
jgi:hypothetical protein